MKNYNQKEEIISLPSLFKKPTDHEALQKYEIKIQFISRGCIVNVGCKTIAFESVESAMKELNEYVKNTYEVQTKWKGMLNCKEF